MRYLLVLLIPLIAAACTPVTLSGSTPTISVSATEQPKTTAVVNGIKKYCGWEANVDDVAEALAKGVPYGTTALDIIQGACVVANSVEVRGRRARNATVVINGVQVRVRRVR